MEWFQSCFWSPYSDQNLSKAIVLFNMTDIFQILPEFTTFILERKPQGVHACQANTDRIWLALTHSTRDA